MTPLLYLDAAVRAVCPIDGIALTNPVTHAVRVDFQPSATAAQITAANNVVSTFDWSATAQNSREAQSAHDAASGLLDNGQTINGESIERIVIALAFTILDEFNVVLPLLTTPKPTITTAQMVTAIKNKLATLPT